MVKLNNSNNNPFYGMRNCLTLFSNLNNIVTNELLHSAYKECDTKEKQEMFFCILFSIGDITNRHHNIFGKKKVDNGGNANRNAFEVILEWMWKSLPTQFERFLNAGLFNQYQCFDSLFKNRIKTYKGKVVQISSVFSDEKYCKVLLNYLAKVIQKGSTFDKMLVAKFLTPPRLSKRKDHKKMLPETKNIMEAKGKFLVKLSQLMGWEYTIKGNICNFKGYRKWRKAYNTNLESVLFSTGKINEFDESKFLQWFDQLPALARQRVMMRVSKSKKWVKFIPWIATWKTFKEEKQKEQRILEEKVRQGTASLEDKVKLEQVKKEAKVTTGAITFNELYKQILNGNVDELKLEAFVQNKVNMPYNNLVIIDGSGSMTGEPYNFAAFLAAICLCKNPDDEARSMLGVFSNETVWYTHIDKELEKPRQRFFRAIARQIAPKPFVNPELSFLQNYRNINNFCQAVFEGGWTDISSLFRSIEWAVKNNSEVLDGFKQYPVWTIISDGEWNNLPSPEASVNDLLTLCDQRLGFKPFIVAIDIANPDKLKRHVERFSGIENFIYIPANVAQIEQFLCNFKDMDVLDIYAPLQSLYRSNRYAPIRQEVI